MVMMGMTEKRLTIRKLLRELMDYNLDAEFEIIGNDGYPIPITELNIGYQVNGGADCDESTRDIYLEKHICEKVTLFEDCMRMERQQ